MPAKVLPAKLATRYIGCLRNSSQPSRCFFIFAFLFPQLQLWLYESKPRSPMAMHYFKNGDQSERIYLNKARLKEQYEPPTALLEPGEPRKIMVACLSPKELATLLTQRSDPFLLKALHSLYTSTEASRSRSIILIDFLAPRSLKYLQFEMKINSLAAVATMVVVTAAQSSCSPPPPTNPCPNPELPEYRCCDADYCYPGCMSYILLRDVFHLPPSWHSVRQWSQWRASKFKARDVGDFLLISPCL